MERTCHVTSSSFDGILSTPLKRCILRCIVVRIFSVRLRDRTSNWRRPVDFIRTLPWDWDHGGLWCHREVSLQVKSDVATVLMATKRMREQKTHTPNYCTRITVENCCGAFANDHVTINIRLINTFGFIEEQLQKLRADCRYQKIGTQMFFILLRSYPLCREISWIDLGIG